ncbi:hypothetical protein BT96DRAFT_721782 [Gymnopus androsaceus JB14]|uniref:PCI domain-containing protein n=1 Tax=Gymnopus androsaceus JB14 TaxID=1447944 RepID=A0A6A4HKZ3_9AGAR|nr:hypothetical protein BT96DRAFT_721782 [Gymnopus androsaceus JB14]
MAEAKVREAQSKASASTTVGVDVDDLEASETPESILLGAVSVDQSKDRTDRALVTPWLKFLWEAYRTSLETLKNNARLEAIYQATAQGAFRFCLAHTRRVEFRRLCDTLRLHLANVGKYAHQPHSINLSDADTLQHHLDTRFAQLGAAVEMELWQEAFRSVEDVHNLLTMAKKAPRPAMMAGYYDKLGKIFLMSGNALYHAAAVGRYYALVVGGALGPKGLSGQEMGELAGKVLISALAVPAHSVGDGSGGGSASTRLTALLGLTKPPTRASLLKDALSRDVLRLAPEPVKKLYHALEVDFSPLGLCGVVAPILGELGQGTGEYKGYLPLLHHALLSRLLGHLAQVYESIKIAYLRELVEPLEAVGSQLEAYVMLLARRGQLDVRVDHAQGCIWFLDEPFASREEEGQDAGTSDSVDAIQPSATTLVQTRLNSVAGCLYSALGMIDANPPSSAQGEEESRFRSLLATLPAYRRSLLLHNSLTARRRQLAQELAARAQAQNLTLQAEVARKAALEQTRLSLLEASQREARRRQDEVERVRRQEAEKYARGLVEGGVLGKEVVEKLTASTTGPIDTTSLIQAQVLALEKSKASFSSRLKTIKQEDRSFGEGI